MVHLGIFTCRTPDALQLYVLIFLEFITNYFYVRQCAHFLVCELFCHICIALYIPSLTNCCHADGDCFSLFTAAGSSPVLHPKWPVVCMSHVSATVGFTLSQATKSLRQSRGIAVLCFRPLH